MPSKTHEWEDIAHRDQPSWYLDRLVAAQKKQTNLGLVRRWTAGLQLERALKTDVFEEAYGSDDILFDVPAACLLGNDIAPTTAHLAARRRHPRAHFFSSDVRRLPLPASSVDLIVSTSTLDHFENAADYRAAIGELARVLRPGGVVVITVDNVRNPLYSLFRWASRRGWTPFRLGYTTSLAGLAQSLESAGLMVTDKDIVIHNPRIVSTLLFIVLRRVLGKYADGPIRGLLALFALMGRLPTREFTGCFVAARAQKPPNDIS
ncbi:MAG: class I SAM-dependent methyltransferase [bacterium]|nr:class I SAM-dependent methyltransferase [bacterium]